MKRIAKNAKSGGVGLASLPAITNPRFIDVYQSSMCGDYVNVTVQVGLTHSEHLIYRCDLAALRKYADQFPVCNWDNRLVMVSL